MLRDPTSKREAGLCLQIITLALTFEASGRQVDSETCKWLAGIYINCEYEDLNLVKSLISTTVGCASHTSSAQNEAIALMFAICKDARTILSDVIVHEDDNEEDRDTTMKIVTQRTAPGFVTGTLNFIENNIQEVKWALSRQGLLQGGEGKGE